MIVRTLSFTVAILLVSSHAFQVSRFVGPALPAASQSMTQEPFSRQAAVCRSTAPNKETPPKDDPPGAENILKKKPKFNAIPPLALNRPRKVLVMVEPSPFTHVSGYANRFKEMLRFLNKAGDDVEIVTVDNLTPKEKLPKSIYGYKIWHTLGFTFPLYKHISLTLDLPEMKGMGVILRQKPDILHVSSPGVLAFMAAFYSRVFRVPLVMSYHTHLPTYASQYLKFIPNVESYAWGVIRLCHQFADLTLVTSPQMAVELKAQGVPRVDVWRKGIDTVRFNPKFRSSKMRNRMSNGNPDDFLITYVGRLGEEKRIGDIRGILEKMPNARFCAVGKGPYMEELKKHFEGTKAEFLGQLSGDELSEAFASADVFVMPSDSETLGFVVLESMASGVPVVGARAGGIPDLIKDEKDGFLVEPGNIDEFVARLKQLQDKKFRAGIAKEARAEAERWGWEAATALLRNNQYERAIVNFYRRFEVGQTWRHHVRMFAQVIAARIMVFLRAGWAPSQSPPNVRRRKDGTWIPNTPKPIVDETAVKV